MVRPADGTLTDQMARSFFRPKLLFFRACPLFTGYKGALIEATMYGKYTAETMAFASHTASWF